MKESSLHLTLAHWRGALVEPKTAAHASQVQHRGHQATAPAPAMQLNESTLP